MNNDINKDNIDRDTTKRQDNNSTDIKKKHRFTPIVPKTKTKWEWFFYRLGCRWERGVASFLDTCKQFRDFFLTVLKKIVELFEFIVEFIIEKLKVKFRSLLLSLKASSEEDDFIENQEGLESYFKPFSKNEWGAGDLDSLPPVVLKDKKPFWSYYEDDPYQFEFACMVLTFPINKKNEVITKLPYFLETYFQDRVSKFFVDEGQFAYRFDLYLAKYHIQRGVYNFDHEADDWYFEEVTAKFQHELKVAKRMKFLLLKKCKNRVYYRRVKKLRFFFQRRSSYASVNQACYELFQRKQHQEDPISYAFTDIWAQNHSKLFFGIPRPRGDCFHLYVYDVGFDALHYKNRNLDEFDLSWNFCLERELGTVDEPIFFFLKSSDKPRPVAEPEIDEEAVELGLRAVEVVMLTVVVLGSLGYLYWVFF